VNESSLTSPILSPARRLQVLILEPDEKVAGEIVSALEQASPGARSAVAQSLSEAQHLVHDQKPALFVLDVDATYDLAQEFIYDLRTSHPSARAIILTAIHFTAQREAVAGLGAIHFFEKPFPRADFITLVEALLAPGSEAEGERFQGTLSDLHIADIIQLKCISGSTSMLEFTGPKGEKARVYFENGQVRHAISPGKEGLAAFNEIVDWKGGMISEVPVPHGTPHTIDIAWQVLLMDAVRNVDESRGVAAQATAAGASRNAGRKVLVIDDSKMLLSFVKEILDDEGYEVSTAPTGGEGLSLCRSFSPDVILLDFVLPDMKGDEVCRHLMADPATSGIPVLYVSGFGSDLQPDRAEIPNVKGSINKPFSSDTLIKAVRSYLPESAGLPSEATIAAETPPPAPMEPVRTQAPPLAFSVIDPTPRATETVSSTGDAGPTNTSGLPPGERSDDPVAPMTEVARVDAPVPANGEQRAPTAYFCGDSSFFSLHWALQTIAHKKLTGTLRAFRSRGSVDLLARDGQAVLVTTRDLDLYCEEAPVTLTNVDRERVEAARARQARDGCPLFVTLADDGLILREPGLQLMQHYGQKLFSRLWTERVRFAFEQQELPGYADELRAAENNIDQWALSTLRFVQYQELDAQPMADMASIPAYTRDGYDRVRQLRLTVAEAQFASQFNGSRSILQITKNLRLDVKFTRLTLFRFLALQIVECWPAQLVEKPESRGGIRGLFGR
jgi:DNA-binding response OmpR family regulator